MHRPPLLQRLTDYTLAIHEAPSYDRLSEVATDAISELISCDWAVLSLAPSISPSPATPRVWTSRHRADWESIACRIQDLSHEDPIYTARLRLTLSGAAPYSDFFPAPDFARSELYNTTWRTLRSDQVLACYTPGRFAYTMLAGRSGSRQFSFTETATLNALARHLDSATARLVAASNGSLSIERRAVPVSTAAWLVCDHSGGVLRATPGTKDLLRRCLGPDASLTRVPNDWRRVFASRARGGPGTPLHYSSLDDAITVYIAPIRAQPGEFTVYFVVERIPPDALARLMSLGLTRREADVLRWATEGKTGPEIGIILGISGLTAKKHMENILHKLGVPTRTAAVAAALQALQRSH